MFDYGHLFSTVCSPIWLLCLLFGMRSSQPTKSIAPYYLLSRQGVAMDFGFWAVVFVSERTIKIAYISAAQRPPRGRRCDSLYCGRFFDGLAQGLGRGCIWLLAWPDNRGFVPNLCAIAHLNAVVY